MLHKHANTTRQSEKGQVVILVILVLALFLIGVLAIATDYTHFWFVRQKVQTAADSVCLSGAVDLYLVATGGETNNMNFTPQSGANLNCANSPAAAPCIIASINGFDGTKPDTTVLLSFPSSVGGTTIPPGVSVPFLQADVTRQAPTFFSKILTAKTTVPVHASATCGLANPGGNAPIIVLHPTDPYTIDMRGSKDAITVVGGPQRSIMVNSKNPQAVTSGSLSTVDLSAAGPNRTGGNFATFGGQSTKPSSVDVGITGAWEYPALPVPDPFAYFNAPVLNTNMLGRIDPAESNCKTAQRGCYGYDGCPNPKGCDQYTAGYYPNGIHIKNTVATFDPGVYYVGTGSISSIGLDLDANSDVRTSTAAGDGSGGVMFFFSGLATLNVDANSGRGNGKNKLDPYYIAGGVHNGVESRAMRCGVNSAPNPPELPATVDGNVLLGPCTGPYADPSGGYRGFVFFQNRINAPTAGPSWQGGGVMTVSGFMYFHQCGIENPKSAKCTGFGDVFHLGGNPNAISYVIGSLVTDKIASNGNPGILFILNPAKVFQQIKITMLR